MSYGQGAAKMARKLLCARAASLSIAVVALRVREAEVYGLDIVDPDTTRPRWLEAIGRCQLTRSTRRGGRWIWL